MDKITFIDYQEPAIDAKHLNDLQKNVENAITNERVYVDTKVGDIVNLMQTL